MASLPMRHAQLRAVLPFCHTVSHDTDTHTTHQPHAPFLELRSAGSNSTRARRTPCVGCAPPRAAACSRSVTAVVTQSGQTYNGAYLVAHIQRNVQVLEQVARIFDLVVLSAEQQAVAVLVRSLPSPSPTQSRSVCVCDLPWASARLPGTRSSHWMSDRTQTGSRKIAAPTSVWCADLATRAMLVIGR